MTSPAQDARESYRAVGHVVGIHGLQGTLKVAPLSDFAERYEKLKVVYFTRADEVIARHELKRFRWGARRLLMSFVGVSRREDAEQLLDTDVCVPESETWVLPPDTYYTSDLVGMRAVGDDGTELGIVKEAREGAQTILEIERAGGELLVPFVSAWVGEIDTTLRTIEILSWQRLTNPDLIEPAPGDDH